MEPNFDAAQYSHDPDKSIEWEQVAQLVIPSNTPANCPICLSPPIAPRSAKCGHLFCFPCIQHYLTLSEHSWRKCPICFESIYLKALKSVLYLPTISYPTPKPSDPAFIDFRLMRRDLNSNIALPIISYRKWKSVVPAVELVHALTFSKMMVASPDYIIQSILAKDAEDLKCHLAKVSEAEDASYEATFIEVCLENIQTAMNSIDPKNVKSLEKRVPDDSENSNYFYQSADGQHIYLHPLDVKILKQEFGSYQDFPSHVKLPVVSIRESTVNQDLRKRCKYLSHLPLTCDISFCETDLSEVVSVATIEHFSSAIDERMARLVKVEQDELEELRLKKQSPAFEYQYRRRHVEYSTSPFESSQPAEVGLSFEDFGPPLPSQSPSETTGVISSASSPAGISFAKMVTTPSSSLASSGAWLRSQSREESSQTAWTLDIREDLLSNVPPSPDTNATVSIGGKKKKGRSKGIMLLGNYGGRARN